MAIATDQLARFVALDREKRDLEARLEDIGKEQGALQNELLEQWADRGQSSANVDGLCVYISHDFYCSKRKEFSTEQLIETLQESGLERVVQIGYNASSLKAFIKEQLASGSEIPENLSAMINYDTVARLRTRAS